MSSSKKIGNLCAFLGLLFIVGIMVLNAITGWLKVDLGVISEILNWTQKVLILLAIGIGGLEFAMSKKRNIQIIYWVAIILYIVFMFI